MLLAAARRPVLNFQRTAGVDFDMCCNAFQFNYYSIYITNILGRSRSSASFAPVHPADPAVGATPSTLREGATPSCTCCLWSLVLLFPYLDSQIEIIIKISRFMKHVWNVKFLIQTHWNVIVSIYTYIHIYIVHMDPIGINIYMCAWRAGHIVRWIGICSMLAVALLSHPQWILAQKASDPQLVGMALSKPETPTAEKAGF